MRYRGWNFEKTLLIESTDAVDRPGELIDAFVTVPTEQAGNIPADVRVLAKSDWNRIDGEIPSQVYGVERHGEVTSFRVVFPLDLTGHGRRRVGVYYGNPDALPPRYETELEVRGDGLGLVVETPAYRVSLDPVSGQIAEMVLKLYRVEFMFPKVLTPAAGPQPGVSVSFAVQRDGGWGAVDASAGGWRDPPVVSLERGPLFLAVSRRGVLEPPGGSLDRPGPVLETTYVFFADRPYILVDSTLSFPETTEVYGVSMNMLTLQTARFSHYTFRPVSPALAATDIEEMGHVIIDPEHTTGLPDGNVLSGFLPHDLAWHACIQIRKGGWASQYALTGISLRAEAAGEAAAPRYRDATYLRRRDGTVTWSRDPVYVRTRDRRETAVTVPAGAGWRHTDALVFGAWDPEGWAPAIEDLGRRLNRPLGVSSHPGLPGRTEPADHGAILTYGSRAGAYLRAGVR